MEEGSSDVLTSAKLTRFPTFRKSWGYLRACCRPGLFVLLGTLVPHLVNYPMRLFWRSYSRLLIDSPAYYLWRERLFLCVVLLAVLSFILALRLAIRPRKTHEARWNWNRIAATLALAVFAASAIHAPARGIYYFAAQLVAEGPRPTEPNMAYLLYDAHRRFRAFSDDDPAKLYPALSRIDARYQNILPERHWRFERKLTTPGLPLRIAFEGRFYYYLGYRVRDDQEIGNYASAYRGALANPDMSQYLALESAGLERLGSYPIRSSIPGLPLPHEAWSGIPLLIEVIDPEKDTEGHVLFCDGHSERIPYPGHWPMTEATVSHLRKLVEESLRARGEDK